jgi:hypothetical protein
VTLGILPLFKVFPGYLEDQEEFVEDAVGVGKTRGNYSKHFRQEVFF